MFQGVTASIASDDAPYVPELQIVQECIMSYTYLANEQLIDVAGGF
jgi:hypothetical protein